MFIDEAIIVVKGGQGGPGKVAFFAKKSGPSGGNGGKGGNVYAELNSNLIDLKKFTERSVFQAENGESGGFNRREGLNGKDLTLQMPTSTTIFDTQTKQEYLINQYSKRILLCRGGQGGYGNEEFKTSTYQTPRHADIGKKGQQRQFKLILKLIADFGLIGLPNAGKSSLLNELTKANVKTASYPFTTLEPNLGVCNGKVLADIPGLIEGASKGRGLGIRFLKHIEKVNLILHCISCESENLKKDYEVVINEISSYNKSILQKKSVILFTKIDLMGEEERNRKIKELSFTGLRVIPLSIYQKDSLQILKDYLISYE